MPEAHFSWRDAGVMRASLLLSAGNLMCEAQNRCALSAEKQKAPEIFRFQVLSYCKWRTDYRAVWRQRGIAFAETLISSNVVRRLPRHVSVAGFRTAVPSAERLPPKAEPQGRRTERRLAHSQGHENNCREAFPPIPSDKKTSVWISIRRRILFAWRLQDESASRSRDFPHKQRRRGTPRWPAPVPVQVRHRPAVGSGNHPPGKRARKSAGGAIPGMPGPWSATTIWNHSPSRWPAMCTTCPAGLYLTAFSTRLHTACRSVSAFPARVQGAASTKMVMLRASAWGAAWSAALRISWPEESRSPRMPAPDWSAQEFAHHGGQAVHLPLDDLEQTPVWPGAEVLLLRNRPIRVFRTASGVRNSWAALREKFLCMTKTWFSRWDI